MYLLWQNWIICWPTLSSWWTLAMSPPPLLLLLLQDHPPPLRSHLLCSYCTLQLQTLSHALPCLVIMAVLWGPEGCWLSYHLRYEEAESLKSYIEYQSKEETLDFLTESSLLFLRHIGAGFGRSTRSSWTLSWAPSLPWTLSLSRDCGYSRNTSDGFECRD